jgi:hypothetical protein
MSEAKSTSTNLPICPSCGRMLDKISESYSTLGMDYKFDGKKYTPITNPDLESISFLCGNCRKQLPEKLVNKSILRLLPTL